MIHAHHIVSIARRQRGTPSQFSDRVKVRLVDVVPMLTSTAYHAKQTRAMKPPALVTSLDHNTHGARLPCILRLGQDSKHVTLQNRGLLYT